MSEELNESGEGQLEGQESEQNSTPEPSPVELQAIESGWVPKDQYNGEEHKWVDAAEFLRRGELFRKIENQSKELKDVKKALVELSKHHKAVREVEYKRALETLKAQKKAAYEEGDVDAVIAADERIDLVREEQRALKQEPIELEQREEAPAEFVEWQERNSWYGTSKPMRAFADALGNELHAAGKAPREVLKEVEAQVKKEFAHKFTNPKQNKPSAVEGASRAGSAGKDSYTLTPLQRRMANQFIASGAIKNIEEYVKQLKEVE